MKKQIFLLAFLSGISYSALADISFYNNFNGGGKKINSLADNENRDINLKKTNGWKNDEIKSLRLTSVTPGTIIRLYDNPDADEEALYKMATEKGTLDTMPDIPGLAVWQKGHIGIYVGDGYTVHAANTSVGVVRTRLDKSGWTHWCKVPGITYLEETEDD